METNQISIKKIGFFIIKKLHYIIFVSYKKKIVIVVNQYGKKTTNI